MPTMSSVATINYSEKHVWLTRTHDSLTQSLAHSYKITPTWVFVENLAGGGDGRRALAHSAVVRRYMANCRTWKSSYRFVLSLVEELPKTPYFEEEDVNPEGQQNALEEALWDVFFCRISSTFRILRSMAEGVRKSLQEGGRDLYGLCAGPGPG